MNLIETEMYLLLKILETKITESSSKTDLN